MGLVMANRNRRIVDFLVWRSDGVNTCCDWIVGPFLHSRKDHEECIAKNGDWDDTLKENVLIIAFAM